MPKATEMNFNGYPENSSYFIPQTKHSIICSIPICLLKCFSKTEASFPTQGQSVATKGMMSLRPTLSNHWLCHVLTDVKNEMLRQSAIFRSVWASCLTYLLPILHHNPSLLRLLSKGCPCDLQSWACTIGHSTLKYFSGNNVSNSIDLLPECRGCINNLGRMYPIDFTLPSWALCWSMELLYISPTLTQSNKTILLCYRIMHKLETKTLGTKFILNIKKKVECA